MGWQRTELTSTIKLKVFEPKHQLTSKENAAALQHQALAAAPAAAPTETLQADAAPAKAVEIAAPSQEVRPVAQHNVPAAAPAVTTFSSHAPAAHMNGAPNAANWQQLQQQVYNNVDTDHMCRYVWQ